MWSDLIRGCDLMYKTIWSDQGILSDQKFWPHLIEAYLIWSDLIQSDSKDLLFPLNLPLSCFTAELDGLTGLLFIQQNIQLHTIIARCHRDKAQKCPLTEIRYDKVKLTMKVTDEFKRNESDQLSSVEKMFQAPEVWISHLYPRFYSTSVVWKLE